MNNVGGNPKRVRATLASLPASSPLSRSTRVDEHPYYFPRDQARRSAPRGLPGVKPN
ncbi:hypothetical protein PUN28_009274 [Cardiocondyla obscurior]|uniref:Ribosomal protein L33 n=1 Tax=Cardiocondyla obscurior TaxID=286306 RepID=A0AAW2FWB4_9HYME